MFGFRKSKNIKFKVKTINDLTRLQKKHGKEAIKIFHTLADEGNLVCQKFMSQSMMEIMDSSDNPSVIDFGRKNFMKYAALASENGDVEEQFNLALFHLQQVDAEQENVSHDDIEHFRKAAYWMRSAADAGFQPALEKVDVYESLAKIGGEKTSVPKQQVQHPKSSELVEGKRLFDLGVLEASKSNFNGALDYYSQSIQACENPVSYLNRARILSKKIRYFEALGDLTKAKLVDYQQGNELQTEIDNEIKNIEFFTTNYENGVREQLMKNYEEKDDDLFIARRIFCASFGVEHTISEHTTYNSPLVEYHFFNELDTIRRFENLEKYPDVALFLKAYPDEFIQIKLNEQVDSEAYNKAQMILHQFLCSYDEDQMRYLRRNIIYDIHSNMIDREYGYMRTMGTSCPGVTKQAYEYLIENQLLDRGEHVL